MERGAEVGQRAAGFVGLGRGNSMCKALTLSRGVGEPLMVSGACSRFPRLKFKKEAGPGCARPFSLVSLVREFAFCLTESGELTEGVRQGVM